MHVVFIEPGFPANQRIFVGALRRAGARVSAIGESSFQSLDGELRHWLHGYLKVPSVCHEPSLMEAVRRIQAQDPVDRLEATVEAHILPAARVREACGIPGTTERTAYLCRDKPAMKDALRAAGVPTAQSTGASSAEEVRQFAAKVGYPLIIKPRDAAGASNTYKVDSDVELDQALGGTPFDRGAQVAVEEFIEGHEGFFDTISIGGTVVHEFVSHYYPNVLEAMRTRWISPQFIATNQVEMASGYREVRTMGRKVIEALGIGTSATHMEWFFGPKGLKFSEIGCRPPGVRAWDLYCAANEMDLYLEWANAIVHGGVAQRPTRRFSAGIIALRPECDGHITGYDGRHGIEKHFAPWIIDAHFPPEGTPTQGVAAGYMANAWLRMRHPDYDELRRMLNTVGETIKVRAR